MFIKQIYTNCLSQASYYIESDGEAIIIDPIRDSNLYPDLVKSRQSKVKYIFETLAARFGSERLAAHFHDTRGLALANIWAALECGIRKFDTSLGGLGGCPFAPGATGNVYTEDVAFLLKKPG